jgi:hypothetical protein
MEIVALDLELREFGQLWRHFAFQGVGNQC